MAKRSGKRSAEDLVAPRFVAAICPTRKLNAAEAAVWAEVTDAWPTDHWIGSDARLLAQYCAFCVQLEEALAEGSVALANQIARVVMAYATKLRITPQSRCQAVTAARAAEHGRENEAGDDRLLQGIEAWSRN